jgi:hypothetical protein
MNAQIQSITEDYGTHMTTVQIGPAKILTAGELSGLLNYFRFRRNWYNPALRTDNTAGGNSQVDMAKGNPAGNTVSGLKDHGQQVHTDWSTQPNGSNPGVIGGQVNNDPKQVTGILAATTPTPVSPFVAGDLKVVQPREVQFCDESGNVVNAIVHMSGLYTKPA